MVRHTNTAQLTKLGHQSGLANAPAEKRHWPSYLLGNLDEGKSEKVFLRLMVCARLSADRKARADFKAFDKIMKRKAGKPPRAGDEIPR